MIHIVPHDLFLPCPRTMHLDSFEVSSQHLHSQSQNDDCSTLCQWYKKKIFFLYGIWHVCPVTRSGLAQPQPDTQAPPKKYSANKRERRLRNRSFFQVQKFEWGFCGNFFQWRGGGKYFFCLQIFCTAQSAQTCMCCNMRLTRRLVIKGPCQCIPCGACNCHPCHMSDRHRSSFPCRPTPPHGLQTQTDTPTVSNTPEHDHWQVWNGWESSFWKWPKVDICEMRGCNRLSKPAS